MNRKIGLSFLGCATLFTPFFTIACNLASRRDAVIMQLAQGQNWPLAFALKPLTEYYNNKFKNDNDFVKVELEFQDKTGTYDEFKLIKNVKDKIITNDYTRLPNIVVGSQTGAYILKQTDNLLDLSKTKVKKDLFSPKIANLHSTLAGQGQETETLFNIPFDNSDLDALVFNYQLLNKMFDLIKNNGGQVDSNAKIVKAAQEAAEKVKTKEKYYTEIPNTTVWSAIEPTSKMAFKSMKKVDDSTFESIQSIRYFSKEFTDGVKLKDSSLTTEILSGSVFSIDYYNGVFYKELNSKLAKDQVIFKLNKDNNVDYNLVTDKKIQDKFKELWKDYTNNTSQRKEKKIEKDGKTKNLVFQSIKYTDRVNDWGSHEIRRFQTAISLAPSVGAAQNKITNVIRPKDDPNFERNNANSGDILMKQQILVSKTGEQKIFSEGGSSILPIDIKNSRLNQGTIKFLEWLYTGENEIVSKIKEENWITLAKNSGYIMPLRSVSKGEEGLKKIREKYESLNKKLDEEKDKDKTKSTDYIALNNLQSAIVSLESILEFETKDDVIAKASVGDEKTAQITRAFAGELFGQTKNDSPTKPKSADELLARFKKIINEK
ncbi:P68 family surface lipoprotein [Mycoplasma putrefaciens]|uniref:Lipoprotein LppB-1 n=2 Tax=Mycoplasma putrefaciens TaxID=2123 RepID=A0A7U3ZT21_MYCPK|nr:hypothetical protein [Mycoplasma putrefaciens]ACF32340.1 LppB [Mycoplasma putrefaciens KS1]AEM68948.1 lipoprotein LppB-1 [Mycoplasma putrefaciens KS1]